jgi:hypothetical protein
MDTALAALRRVNFDWTAHIDEIWVDQPRETSKLQAEIRKELEDHLDDLADSTSAASPLGVPLLGPAGSGKTHLLGVLRRSALSRGMYFILADMTDVADFWDTVSLGYLRSLQQQLSDGRRQVDHWLERMIQRFGQGMKKAQDIHRQRPPGLINRIEELLTQVRAQHRAEIQEHADVLRALVLFACDHADVNDLGYKWLQGLVIDEEELGVFGFRQRNQSPSRIVRGISWLLSLTGPTVLALDQLDAIVAEHDLARGEGDSESNSEQQRRSQAIIQGIASGFLELRDVTRRSLSVVSSLEATWNILDRQALVSMVDRFGEKLLLKPASSAEALTELILGRLAPVYALQGYEPPYPSYPFGETFFRLYRHNTPREVLKACEAHRKACRKAELVTEAGGDEPTPSRRPPPHGWAELLEKRLAELVSAADPDAVLGDDSETLQDRVVEAACRALVIENPVPESVLATVEKDFMGTGSYDPLHARIRLLLTQESERERHHSFRFLEKADYRAFQARLKAALTASGIDRELSFRGLTIFRSSSIPTGAATQKLVAELQARGGRILQPSRDELATLMAVKELLDSNETRFEEWLAERRIVSGMACFASAVHTLFGSLSSDRPVATQEAQTAPVRRQPPTDQKGPEILRDFLPIGRRLSGGEPQGEVGIPRDRLPYHTCVFAGSGSGKTVFLKRVIEEAALLGIPSIVLDGANDLSRLGAAWPERPEAFSDEDAAKSRQYIGKAEVIVWTPGAAVGNPMRLNPLPDFATTSKSADEREAELQAAIEIATSSIADMVIKQKGGSAKKQIAILKATLRYFAKKGGSIRDLANLLREPPEDVIEPYEKGDKLARELAELLHAEIESDPLLGGSGAPLDPSVLLRSNNQGKTRVSVINLVGLPGYDQKRRFVDQLASSLFSWIKKNPAAPGGVLGLFVMDEAKDFVPSGKAVPGKENVIRLAAQARKYGLGLLFATQEPKSIDHTIVSNCSTLLGGKMSSPAAIDALQQLIADKGGRANDVAALKRGTFYFGSGADKPHKIATSLCLSYHPSSPPTETEILESARRSAPSWR